MKAVSLEDPPPPVAETRDFPTVEVSQRERSNRALDAETHERAWHLFSMWGVVRWLHAFEPAFMGELANHYRVRYRDQLREADEQNRRPLFTPKLSGPLGDETYHSNPLLMPIIKRVLGDDVVLGGSGSMVSFPGAAAEDAHRGSQSLYDDYTLDVRLPPYALSVLVPLWDADPQTGATQVWPGTHRVPSFEAAQAKPSATPDLPAGSALMIDSRTLRCAAPNRSQVARPVAYNSYHRSWYRSVGGADLGPAVYLGAVAQVRLTREKREKRDFFRIPREDSVVDHIEWRVKHLTALALQNHTLRSIVRAFRKKGS